MKASIMTQIDVIEFRSRIAGIQLSDNRDFAIFTSFLSFLSDDEDLVHDCDSLHFGKGRRRKSYRNSLYSSLMVSTVLVTSFTLGQIVFFGFLVV